MADIVTLKKGTTELHPQTEISAVIDLQTELNKLKLPETSGLTTTKKYVLQITHNGTAWVAAWVEDTMLRG